MTGSPLDEFKRSLLPNILQKKIYGFLRYGFEKWPLDSSFRMMLETWLTYIQPWRYSDLGSKQQEKEADTVQDIWFPFIRDNFLFYASLLQEFLQRCLRMDLTSLHNAYMLFRVTKVFSLKNLPQLLREVEKMMYSSTYKQSQDLSGSYIAPEISAILRVQISELERPDFMYIDLFGAEMDKVIHHLLQSIGMARSTLISQAPEKKTEKSGFASLFDFSALFDDTATGYGDMSPNEVKKLEMHLESAASNLCSIFSLRLGDVSSLYSPSDLSNQTLLQPPSQGTPDCYITNHGPQLSPLGKYQLMNGIRKFDIEFHGDPDLQPIRSFENKLLVRLMYKVSTFFNQNYKNEIQSMYSRRDFIGKLSRIFFSPPLSPYKTPRSPVSRLEFEKLQQPRLSLRFLASYQTLLYLGVMYAFLSLTWNIDIIQFVIFLVLCVFVYGLFRALTLNEDDRAARQKT